MRSKYDKKAETHCFIPSIIQKRTGQKGMVVVKKQPVHHMCRLHRGFLTRRAALARLVSSRWASHPSVSVFALSWQQRYDRSRVGVRDELWGDGRDFFFLQGGRTESTRARNQAETVDGEPRERGGEGVFISPTLRSRARCYCLV